MLCATRRWCSRMGVRDRHLFAVVAVGGSWRQPRPGVARTGWEQPRQSRAGSVLPDGSGAVSETRRYTRGTGCVTPLDTMPAVIRWIGWFAVRTRSHDGWGTLGWGLV